MYVGKGAACVQNGEVKTFKRKVRKALRFTSFQDLKGKFHRTQRMQIQ